MLSCQYSTLAKGHDRKKRQDRQAGGWQNGSREMELPGPVGYTPAHHQKEADEGDVGVEIGAGLEINLDDRCARHSGLPISRFCTTDSTLTGCTAKSAATMKLRLVKPVALRRIQKSNSALSPAQAAPALNSAKRWKPLASPGGAGQVYTICRHWSLELRSR
jgi:hypothetical protein